MKDEERKLHRHLHTEEEIDFILGTILEAENKPRNIISGTLDEVLEHIRATDFAARRIRPKQPRKVLSAEKWRKLKEYIFERDNYCCVWCGNPNNLTAAHIIRRSAGGHDSPNNVVTGCCVSIHGGKGCHQRFDEYEIGLPNHIAEMLAGEPEEI